MLPLYTLEGMPAVQIDEINERTKFPHTIPIGIENSISTN